MGIALIMLATLVIFKCILSKPRRQALMQGGGSGEADESKLLQQTSILAGGNEVINTSANSLGLSLSRSGFPSVESREGKGEQWKMASS